MELAGSKSIGAEVPAGRPRRYSGSTLPKRRRGGPPWRGPLRKFALRLLCATLLTGCARNDQEIGRVFPEAGSPDEDPAAAASPSADGSAAAPGGACTLNPDGTCSAATAGISCLPFRGRLFDGPNDCLLPEETVLYCAAFASGSPAGFVPAAGCYQATTAETGTSWYWTAQRDPEDGQAHACDAAAEAQVMAAAACGT